MAAVLALGIGTPFANAAEAGKPTAAAEHWSFKPIVRPPVPVPAEGRSKWARTPIDDFIFAGLRERRLSPSPDADRRTLIRRLSYDLTGLPPSPEDVAQFVADPAPGAYEKLVDRLLASPRYGERWGRHWLDTVHYGDTHGYDKDKLRPNAWPYRDYVIRAFNDDKPYARFVQEQLAGDRLYPGTRDGIIALGFIAAGPFDFVGQVELRDGTIDKAITRNLDRDDMVAATMNTFVSLTVQCARCHNHKFDPIGQEDYYSLQAVFAGVDRADRPYDHDPDVGRKRSDLQQRLIALTARAAEIEARAAKAVAPELAAIDGKIAVASKPADAPERPEFGYHSGIEPTQSVAKWVQVDLGRSMPIREIVLVGAHDTFNGIGAGFGFPVRFKVEASDDPAFAAGVTTIVDRTGADVPNPGVSPQSLAAGGKAARFVRVTATRLAPRQNDFIFALGELLVVTPDGTNAALGKEVSALDSIEAPVRWSKKNLVDGYYYAAGANALGLSKLREQRSEMLDGALNPAAREELQNVRQTKARAESDLKMLPAQSEVFAAASEFPASGSFVPTLGKPRPIFLLHRGSEKDPGKEVGPGAVGFLPDLPGRFDLPPGGDESLRRAALAQWIVDPKNPLTWRSIVNRVWQYHFGRGIVETPNDFGKMGATPTHPELLDWLAAEFRDGGKWIKTPGSIKALHRLIVTSSVYRQSSASNPEYEKTDGGNQYLWRMNRDRLDAEAIRDSVLLVSGKLDLTMGGPGYMDFGFKDDHSPHYQYQDYDPDDVKSHRRSVYRLAVRSSPDPLLETLDCADPSQLVPRRNETLTPLQALALMNNKLIVRMSEHFARRLEAITPDPVGQIDAAYRLALGRPPTAEESTVLVELARKDGLANVCRLIFNMNEFVFVD
ncbi:MAG TPA: DUF1553 domain-containing protein [Tepidisphaeraceae bacterium]|nr:DUF1553 domain-containing protein [Tepidisphaeraceae bacterium]